MEYVEFLRREGDDGTEMGQETEDHKEIASQLEPGIDDLNGSREKEGCGWLQVGIRYQRRRRRQENTEMLDEISQKAQDLAGMN